MYESKHHMKTYTHKTLNSRCNSRLRTLLAIVSRQFVILSENSCEVFLKYFKKGRLVSNTIYWRWNVHKLLSFKISVEISQGRFFLETSGLCNPQGVDCILLMSVT